MFKNARRAFFFFKQKTAYEIVVSDWSSDVCSSDLFSIRSSQVFQLKSLSRFWSPHPLKPANKSLALSPGFFSLPCSLARSLPPSLSLSRSTISLLFLGAACPPSPPQPSSGRQRSGGGVLEPPSPPPPAGRAQEEHGSRGSSLGAVGVSLWAVEEVRGSPGSSHSSALTRSEERRVGKECLRLCRSRWSPYH